MSGEAGTTVVAEAGTTVVAEAADVIEAGAWVDALRAAGIPATSFERGVGAALGGATTAGFSRYPILVPSGDIARARTVLADHGAAMRLTPFRTREEMHASQMRALRTVAAIAAVVIVLAVLAKLAAG